MNHRMVEDPDAQEVTQEDFDRAIGRIVEVLEPLEERANNGEDYHALLAAQEEPLKADRKVLRDYALGVEPPTIERLQEVFYATLDGGDYKRSAVVLSIVGTELKQAFTGVFGWVA